MDAPPLQRGHHAERHRGAHPGPAAAGRADAAPGRVRRQRALQDRHHRHRLRLGPDLRRRRRHPVDEAEEGEPAARRRRDLQERDGVGPRRGLLHRRFDGLRGHPASGADEGTNSPCNGDSGGPLVVGNKIVGIVSWGVAGCTAKGAYPVFTKVSSYTWAAQPRIDDADLSYDGRADLLARTPSGGLFQQNSTGTSLAQRAYQGTGWQSATWALQADLDRDFYQDLIIRDRTDGKLYRSYLDHSVGDWTWMQISSVWGGYKSYAIPGDMTGDARPDLVAVDADGSVYLYPGRGNGQFYGKVKVVGGAWKNVKVLGHGDLSGDGKPDLLVRSTDGTLWLYRGTGKEKTPWSARIKARTGWNFTSYVSNGDVTGDGIADVITRDSAGKLWLYRGTNKPSSDLFATRTSLGTGFNQYNLLF